MHETKHFESENRWHQTCLIALCANENTKKKRGTCYQRSKGQNTLPSPSPAPDGERNPVLGPEWLLLDDLRHP